MTAAHLLMEEVKLSLYIKEASLIRLPSCYSDNQGYPFQELLI
jgi:hypothetical protein